MFQFSVTFPYIHYSCRTSQLSPDTCKCESHRNVRVLNVFARLFQFLLHSALQWGKDPIVGIKRRGCLAEKETGTTNQYHQRKGKSRLKMQKKTNSLIFFSVVSIPIISEVEYSRTFRKQPPKMQRLSHRLQEMLPIKNRTTWGLF